MSTSSKESCCLPLLLNASSFKMCFISLTLLVLCRFFWVDRDRYVSGYSLPLHI
ncbi:hypothetical protein RchiOBHm_Chr7g0189171 [Rosa chinensis]|uniref:Uncharacterized protein n=1 Tax=Rosa chinensis TaxID=74649 RepID=A0A2P6P4P0_ROSCH|nr:hypothetical protein RchiOBHm_Chr7g0189171 [Rosa chinensis]